MSVNRSVERIEQPSVRAEMTATWRSKGRMFMGPIHEVVGLARAALVSAARKSYIRCNDHSLRGPIPRLRSLGAGSLQRLGPTCGVPGLRFERRSPRCKGGVLPLDEPGVARRAILLLSL